MQFQPFQHRNLNQSIQEALISYILSTGLKEGDRLPSQSEIVRQMNVSRTSLRESIAQLEARGILKQVQGSGTYLCSNPDEYKTNVEMETSITEMILGMGKKPGTLEVHLEWRPLLEEFSGVYGEIQDCICLERTRTADEELFAVSIAFLAPGLIDSPDEIKIHKHSESLFDFLDEYCGVSPVYFENEIEIVFPDANIAKKLHITPSDPIFKLRRYQYSAENKLLVVSSDFFNLKKLSFKVNRYRLVDPIGKKYIQEEKN